MRTPGQAYRTLRLRVLDPLQAQPRGWERRPGESSVLRRDNAGDVVGVLAGAAWEAERVSGSLAFELEPAHMALFQTPPRVDVVVTLPTGEEVRCGSLGEFVLQTLAQLGVTVLAHRVTAPMLDDRLALVVEALVRREVWRFDHGTGGRRPGYTIHPSFSDACYRALGSRAFYRLGSSITAAVRRVAETWARDRVARAGGSSVGGTA